MTVSLQPGNGWASGFFKAGPETVLFWVPAQHLLVLFCITCQHPFLPPQTPRCPPWPPSLLRSFRSSVAPVSGLAKGLGPACLGEGVGSQGCSWTTGVAWAVPGGQVPLRVLIGPTHHAAAASEGRRRSVMLSQVGIRISCQLLNTLGPRFPCL